MKASGSSDVSASRVDGNELVGGRGAVNKGAIGRSDVSRKSAKLKSQTKSEHLGNSNNLKEPKFLTSNAKEVFNYLRQAFTKVLILYHFDPQCYIWIETDVSGYAIGEVLS